MPFVHALTTVSLAGLLASLAVSSSASAEEQVPPPAVVVTAEDSALNVGWAAIDGGDVPVTGYHVTAAPTGTVTEAAQMDTPADSTSTDLTGLDNGVSYDVQVVALRADGSSLAAPSSVIGTPRTHPAAPIITAVRALDGAAQVSWSAPDDGGSPVTSYVVTAGNSPAVSSVAASALTTVLAGLPNGTASSIKVAAVNDAGVGAPSAAATVTPRKPAHLVVTTSPAQVTYGAVSTIAARVLSQTGLPVAHTIVQLRGRTAGTSSWRTLASGTSTSDGRVTLKAALPANTALTLHHATDSVITSDATVGTAHVAYRVTVGSRHPAVRVGHALTVAGKISPSQPKGTRVTLQRWWSGSWRTVSTGRVAAYSSYRMTWTPRQVASSPLRVVKAGDALRTAGVSVSWRQRVSAQNAADIARDILHNRRITLADVHESGVDDAATALHNIRDIAAGRLAHRSSYQNAPGGSTRVNLGLLRAIRAMGVHLHVTISEIAGGSHAVDSGHYAGRAVDVTVVNGRSVAGGASYAAVVRICLANGATTVFDPGYDPYGGHSNHVHCGW